MNARLRNLLLCFLILVMITMPLNNVISAQETIQPQIPAYSPLSAESKLLDVDALEGSVDKIEAIVNRLKGLKIPDDFVSNTCILGVCGDFPNFDKPAWNDVRVSLVDLESALEGIETFIDSVPGATLIPTVASIRATVASIRQTVSTINDTIDRILVIKACIDDISSCNPLDLLKTDSGQYTPANLLDPVGTIVNEFKDKVEGSLSGNLATLLGDTSSLQTEVMKLGVFERTDSALPVFTINSDSGYTYVHFFLINQMGQAIYDEWLPLNCNNEICHAIPFGGLVGGAYTVYYQIYSPSQEFDIDVWYGPVAYDLPVSAPSITQIQSFTPTRSGNQITFSFKPVSNASYYQFWIGTPEPEWSQQYWNWHSTQELGCADLETCLFTPLVNFDPNASYVWYISAWGPGGMNTDGVASGGFFWQEGMPVAPIKVTRIPSASDIQSP